MLPCVALRARSPHSKRTKMWLESQKKKKVSTCKKPFVCKEKPTECKKSKCVCRKGKSKWICIQSPKSELANKDSNEFVPFEDLDWDSEGLEDMTENEDVTEGEDLEIE